MTSPRIADRFAFHRSTPQITVDEYERRRVIELGEWVAARDRIYLDKCFWIHLRECWAQRSSIGTLGLVTCPRKIRTGQN